MSTQKLPIYDDSSIKQMTQLEHLRAKSSMYIDADDVGADKQLFKEIIDNSADESILPDHLYNIKVVFFVGKGRYQVCIIDHGRGIPCNKLKVIYTEAFSSGKYSNEAYHGISTGIFGIGSKCCTALSRKFIAISKRLDGFAGLTVEQGVVKDNVVTTPIDNDPNTVGTTVLYETDQTILKESHIYIDSPEGLAESIKLLEYIGAFKPNTKFQVYRINKLLPETWFKQSYQDMWMYLYTVTGELIFQTPDIIDPFTYARDENNITSPTIWNLKLFKPVDLTNENDTFGFDIHLGMVKDCERQNGILATVNSNFINTPISSHIDVLMDRLKNRIVAYLDEDDTELRVFFDTKYMLPVHGYICAFSKSPKFEGQTKKSFKDLEFATHYGAYIDKLLNKEPDELWGELFDLVNDDLMKRFAASESRLLNTGKSLKNAAWSMKNEGSYIPCKINNPDVTELLITEGNSAGDWVKQVRNATFQAVLKMRGKPINAIIADSAALRANAVYQDMVRLFGVTPRDTDLSNFNFRNVGLLADADPDGYHILSLLIGSIYKINPLILESGKVFIANPPLYVLESNNRNLFLRDQKALNDSRVLIYDNYFKIMLWNSKSDATIELSGQSFRDFVYLVKRIGTVITDVANKLVIDPFVLEQLIGCVEYLTPYNLNCDMIKQQLNLESCSYHEIANTLLLVSDGMEISVPMKRLVHEIRAYILPEIQPIHWGTLYPIVTTKHSDTYENEALTYMQIYNIFNEIDTAYPVRRLKGLGECTPEQLRYTCVDPVTRTYTTITSIGDVEKLYKLLGVDTELRKSLVVKDLNDLFAREDE